MAGNVTAAGRVYTMVAAAAPPPTYDRCRFYYYIYFVFRFREVVSESDAVPRRRPTRENTTRIHRVAGRRRRHRRRRRRRRRKEERETNRPRRRPDSTRHTGRRRAVTPAPFFVYVRAPSSLCSSPSARVVICPFWPLDVRATCGHRPPRQNTVSTLPSLFISNVIENPFRKHVTPEYTYAGTRNVRVSDTITPVENA